MSKSTKKSLEIFNTPIHEESLREECEKYGIEYHEPFFLPILGFTENINIMVLYPKHFVLETEIKNNEFYTLINKYTDALMKLTSFNASLLEPVTLREIVACFKFYSSLRKLNKFAKKNNIAFYSQYGMDEYIANYKKEKEAELKKAKAIVEVAKKEMTLEK